MCDCQRQVVRRGVNYPGKTYLENSNPPRALCNHCDAIILPGLAIEASRRVQSAVLRHRDIRDVLLIDDKETGARSRRAGAVLRKHLSDVRARDVFLGVEDERSGGRSPAINGHRVSDKQTELRGVVDF